ncbi:LacI family DNA-binding transcriptional regulator [Paenibacillus tyrfis]|uniref:HTH lacI-type domain-containing protein n=1 Tax=Paenibacillus tyrfis TaxID=1501230 RepID=A0A081P5D7_9BACL|nr:LacI family DNA-binding transcriptional regulator [Paenibacillus tyrfis]KEQ25910.1 hypothetical protein ET33_35550 [Paenibacillus tyrfis]
MVTIKDIAQQANVSTTTVSRVLNNDQSFNVSEKTRNKVLEVARRLGYKTIVERYNKKHYRLALVYKSFIFNSHLDNDFHFSIRSGIDRVCLQYEIDSINVFNFTNMSASHIHGAIIQGNYTDEEITGIARSLDTDKILVIGRCPNDNKFDSVWFDTKKAIHSALDYLTGLGHRDIGYIGSIESPDLEFEDRRDQVFLRYMSKFPEFKSSRIYIGENGIKSGYKMMERAFHEGPLPSAFFIANDPNAIGALEFLKEQNISVPGMVSIVGFNDHSMARYTTPSLTTVHIPTEYMGQTAVQTIIERIEDVRSMCKKVLIPTQLMIRNSAERLQTKNR